MVGLHDIEGAHVVLEDGEYEVLEVAVWNGADYDAIWPTADDGGFGKLFEKVVDNGVVIGAKALFDLYIIQQEADDEADPPVVEVTKDISELLRHITLGAGADAPINFDRGIVSTGNITAGGLNGSDAIGNVLYRFDESSWSAYNAATQAGWVPSMSFLRSEVLRLETMINSSPGGGGSSNVSFTPVTTEYGTLGIDGVTYQIRTWDNVS
ncbi:MAG: hypothetical protein II661_01180, partial [Bacteroidales bacterium]|nr:hypothetical protein [Bacteroidales bacterium]